LLALGQFSLEGKPVADGAHGNPPVELEQRGWLAENISPGRDLVGQADSHL
jgi:hypothetical protein